MPRNTSTGVYSLPSGNPVVTNTTISSTWANTTLSDIGNEITYSLSRLGYGGMLAAFLNSDGTVSAPGISFTAENGTGFFRNAAGDLRVTLLGAVVARFLNSAFQMSPDAGSSWHTPCYLDIAATVTAAYNFTGGLSINGTGVGAVNVNLASTSTGTFSTTSASLTLVTNAQATLTTNGNPVLVMLVPDGTNNAGGVQTTGSTSVQGDATFCFSTNNTGSAYFALLEIINPTSSIGTTSGEVPPGAVLAYFTGAAGTYTFYLLCKANNGATTVQVKYSKLLAIQLN
jgi:hypothetical protein